MYPRDGRPLIALTMGDVTGIGPEVIARAWTETPLRNMARLFVVGSRPVLERALACVGGDATVQEIARPEDADPDSRVIPCLEATHEDVSSIPPGRVDPRAGRAAFDFLTTAADLALAGRIDAITTLPLNKEALHAGGIRHPGHTEILAERCGVDDPRHDALRRTSDRGRRCGPRRPARHAPRRLAARLRPDHRGAGRIEDPSGRPGVSDP